MHLLVVFPLLQISSACIPFTKVYHSQVSLPVYGAFDDITSSPPVAYVTSHFSTCEYFFPPEDVDRIVDFTTTFTLAEMGENGTLQNIVPLTMSHVGHVYSLLYYPQAGYLLAEVGQTVNKMDNSNIHILQMGINDGEVTYSRSIMAGPPGEVKIVPSPNGEKLLLVHKDKGLKALVMGIRDACNLTPRTLFINHNSPDDFLGSSMNNTRVQWTSNAQVRIISTPHSLLESGLQVDAYPRVFTWNVTHRPELVSDVRVNDKGNDELCLLGADTTSSSVRKSLEGGKELILTNDLRIVEEKSIDVKNTFLCGAKGAEEMTKSKRCLIISIQKRSGCFQSCKVEEEWYSIGVQSCLGVGTRHVCEKLTGSSWN